MLHDLIPKPYSDYRYLKENTISIFKGWGFRAGENGFSMWVLVYVFEVGFFLCGSWCGSFDGSIMWVLDWVFRWVEG